MKTPNEHAPDIIFEWLCLPFTALGEEQQTVVRSYFTEREYEDMHLAMLAIGDKDGFVAGTNYRIKQDLLLQFDKKFGGKTKMVHLFTQVNVWRAAAVLFFVMSTWFAIHLLRPDELIRSKTITVTDTVYIEKKYSDTVAERAIARQMPHVQERQNDLTPAEESLTGHFELKAGALHVLSLETLDEEENLQKNNSLQDDSLVRHFSFITL